MAQQKLWFLTICLFLVVAVNAQLDMKLRLLPNTAQSGAVCLDGTPAGYYISTTSGLNSSEWIIFIQGGGWCYSPADCFGRSKTDLGSSSQWPATTTDMDGMSGFITDNCSVNPTFCHFSKVVINYCDGTSFTSNNATPVVYNGTNLYFRGRVILYNVIQDLLKNNLNFSRATTVLLSGCSAGGLSTYHAADFVKSLLPASVTKYAAIPSSGYFLLESNANNVPVYPNEMRITFEMGNCSYGVSKQCLQAYPEKDAYKCLFAQNALHFVQSPIFISNSMFDSWQLACIFTSEPVITNPYQNGNCSAAPGWASCLRNLDNCSALQFDQLNKYARRFASILNATGTIHKSGNGGFIVSCMWHCELISAGIWDFFKINGVTMQQAVDQWWNSLSLPEHERQAVNNWHWDCEVYTSESPFVCNSQCTAL